MNSYKYIGKTYVFFYSYIEFRVKMKYNKKYANTLIKIQKGRDIMKWQKVENDSPVTSWVGENSYLQIMVSTSKSAEEALPISANRWTANLMSLLCKNSKNESIEPDYAIKLMVLKELGFWKQLAIEIYPQESKRHGTHSWWMWELKNPESIEGITEVPMFAKLEGTAKVFSSTGEVKFLFTELEKWEEKQQLKNKMFSEESVAIELICDTFANKGYSCLIVFPDGDKIKLPLN